MKISLSSLARPALAVAGAVGMATVAFAADAPAAAPPPPVPNKGDTAYMMLSTVLVLSMIVPGLALFYGGLVRAKNMLSVLMQVMVGASMIFVLWAIYGYSLAFTGGSPYFGGLDKAFLAGITAESVAATFSRGVVIPELMFVAFQGTFAAITCALIVGSVAERIKFSAVLLLLVIWFTFAYIPTAHMVWYWDGPDAIKVGDPKSLEAVVAAAGALWAKGALDFAGGTVVHINAGIAGLVAAYMVGKRVGYGKEPMPPHNLVMTMVGAAMLWVGWFGFNAGSNLEATGVAALAVTNTLFATAAAVVAWTLGESIFRDKPSMLGAASGAVAGLVAITPAAGFVGITGALVIGLVAGFVCLWGVTGLKKMLKADDSLDVFGIHGIGGIIGAILTGVFTAPSLGGTGVFDYVADKVGEYSISAQVAIQTEAVITTVILSGVVSVVALFIVKMVMGLRVSEEEEREGLDVTSHGEKAYYM